MENVVIIGGGAAGMMSGITLAEKGYKVTIIEKNDKLGKKLFITGKGRCNLTNNCDTEDLIKNVVTNSKFLYSALYGFNSFDTMNFFEKLGLKIKTERGNRVFPVSDHSSDVISVLSTRLKRLGVQIMLLTEVLDIEVETDDSDERMVKGVKIKPSNGKESFIPSEYVVVATGGVSYPLTGSTGDGIKWAQKLGLVIVPPRPALVPMETRESFCRDLMGMTLKNVSMDFLTKVRGKDKIVYSGFGELLFTHFGVSGPEVLSASSYLAKYIDQNIKLVIDLKPAISEEQLDERIRRDFSENINKQFRNSLSDLLPKKLIPVIIDMAGIDPYKRVNEISREERLKLVNILKHFELHITGFRDFNEAIITQGGVSVKEINPQNMECKSIKGLRFVGEVLDVDALTGGYNLQIAWSTAAALD